MFENLTERLNQSFKNFIGRGSLTESNIKETLKEVRNALIEADVAFDAVKAFVQTIKEKAIGLQVSPGLSPAQMLVKLVNEQLIELMGENPAQINFKTQGPAVILMAGLQGSGKTTTAAKLSKWLIEKENKKVLLASADVYRPAAIDQLKVLAQEVNANFFESHAEQNPIDIAQNALKAAKEQFVDVVIIDTAGRLHIDEAMMSEIKGIHRAIDPIETLFVVDGMMGQDAAVTAQTFNEALPLTGVVVTKLDGDARGGAILSVQHVTQGKPIKFIGVGEKVGALEAFYPDRMASRILGMGDVLSLVEELEQHVDKEQADKLAKRIQRGTFNLEDFQKQLLQMNKMGGITQMAQKLPGMGGIANAPEAKQAGEKSMAQMLAIINSMTPKERKKPLLIKGSRKRRIARGSGTTIQDVNRVLKQFTMMQKMMKKMSKKGGISKMFEQMKGLMGQGGGLPPF